MAKEIELKLSLPDTQRQKFLRLERLRQAVSRQTCTLTNRYYDTPSLDLQQQGIALRTRQQGHRCLQTVKCAGNSVGGLSSRPEWETDYTGSFDFSHIENPHVRELLEQTETRKRLTVLFETHFRRTTWRFEPTPDCTLLLMLDHGEILASERRVPICEVEIELASPADPGHLDAIFDLAQDLSAHIPLRPTSKSKAERGYQLFFGESPLPRKAKSVPLDACETPLQAFRKIALECLDHLQSNAENTPDSPPPEFIHQMRIATRRLRSALRLFSPWLPDGRFHGMQSSLRQLAGQLGPVRNLDVLLTDILPPAMERLPACSALKTLHRRIEQQRQQACQAALQHLQSPDHARFMLHLTKQLQEDIRVPQKENAAGEKPPSLPEQLRPRIKRSLKKLQHLAATTEHDNPASVHRLRIAIKRLRHALEFSSSRLKTKGLEKLLAQLIRLQDDLGQLNDLAHAGPPLLQCAQNEPELLAAVASIGKCHLDRYYALLAGLPEQLERLEQARCPSALHERPHGKAKE